MELTEAQRAVIGSVLRAFTSAIRAFDETSAESSAGYAAAGGVITKAFTDLGVPGDAIERIAEYVENEGKDEAENEGDPPAQEETSEDASTTEAAAEEEAAKTPDSKGEAKTAKKKKETRRLGRSEG